METGLLDIGIATQQWAALVLVFGIRLYVTMMVLPATADEMMPHFVRNGLVGVFALHCAAGSSPEALQAAITSGGGLVVLVAREGAIGLTIGFAAAKLFWVAQSVGALIDNLSGYNNVQLNNPTSTEQTTPVSNLMSQLAAAVFYVSGGLLFLLGAIVQTYEWWPVLQAEPTWPSWPKALAGDTMAQLMRLVAAVAGPALFILAFLDLGMGILSRSAKNIDTSSVSTPLKAAAALLSMVFFAGLFLDDAKTYLSLAPLADWLSTLKGTP